MKIYRVCTLSNLKEGPYDSTIVQKWISKNAHKNKPTPMKDGIKLNLDYRCCFSTLEQAKKWFNNKLENSKLNSLGYYLVCFNIPDNAKVLAGKKQIMIHRKYLIDKNIDHILPVSDKKYNFEKKDRNWLQKAVVKRIEENNIPDDVFIPKILTIEDIDQEATKERLNNTANLLAGLGELKKSSDEQMLSIGKAAATAEQAIKYYNVINENFKKLGQWIKKEDKEDEK